MKRAGVQNKESVTSASVQQWDDGKDADNHERGKEQRVIVPV
eukprot:CAMPEP_0113902546 /NCGR_PEP_ID=MMETSP0780_2-20120614/21912_1 /TAXON_ID=652834 /ORGANISM="Palpitomonas bilix" /LENGTH=41 /DNA_ID=CAMNT_0000895367 /DNA_START=165 /DNA_END=290 /DNA_ORIENTATION=+ /assembly_acc=CAM_ASM_000599